jgi:hypothetical protein
MNLTEISFNGVKNQIESFLREEHAKANLLFSVSSPYGQILSVLENLFQLSMLYLKNTIKQYDLSELSSTNARIIRNAAIFAGHIPTRGISATGTLKITVKTSADLEEELAGGRMTLSNRAALKNKTNGLEYALNLGTDRISYKVTSNTTIFIPIIQGKWEKRSFTGSGQQNQTYQVTLRNGREIENFNYEILVNGEMWTVKKHVFDLLPDEKACVVRTSFDFGIDVIFGNGSFGAIPLVGSVIDVIYLVTDGSIGSIFRRTPNDWTFIDQPVDGDGVDFDLANLFDVSIYTDINFGADRESTSFTKNLLPISSNNFVLGLPEQFAYQIKKLGIFSHINAYERNGTIFIVATPNINLFKSQNANYFNIDIRAFELDAYEKSKIDLYLRTAGNLMLTRNYIINSPKLTYYVLNVFIITYADAQDDSVNSQIHDKVSQYFLNFTRLKRVPKSDLIAEISSIKDIHSVDVSFVSKNNEDYHKNNMIADENRRNQFASKESIKIKRPNPTYNQRETKGLDPVLGDIIFEPDELPVIRGGWYDRNTIYYSSDIEENGLKSINIIKKGTADSSLRQKI